MNSEELAKQFLAENDTDKLEGLDIDEHNGVMEKVFKKKQLDHAQLFFRVFSTEDGQKVMTKLVNKHVLAPTVMPNDDPYSIGIREGQKRLTLWIMQQIEIAKKG